MRDSQEESVALLTMLYKNNGAVSCVVSDSLSDWALYRGIQQGGSEVRISSWTGLNHGQISIETATHSLKRVIM